MRTIDDAELAGWQGLELHCGHCRMIVHRRWEWFRRRQPWRRLDDIVDRLVCEKCRQKPASVMLLRFVSTIGGDRTETAPLSEPTPQAQPVRPGVPAAAHDVANVVRKILRLKRPGGRR